MMEPTPGRGTPKEVVIRNNLFIAPSSPDGKPKLICSRCYVCQSTFYPKEEICPKCIKERTLETIEIDGSGKLKAFTRVFRGLQGFDSPYALGSIELEEGPVLIAQLEDWQGIELRLNMPVQLVIGRIKREKDGTIVIGPKFRPIVQQERG